MKIIEENNFDLHDLEDWLVNKIGLSEKTKNKIKKNHQFLLKKVSENKAIYGVNTGFGALCNSKIQNEELGLLQKKLIQSHAVGVGEILPKKISKTMLLFKIFGLSKLSCKFIWVKRWRLIEGSRSSTSRSLLLYDE